MEEVKTTEEKSKSGWFGFMVFIGLAIVVISICMLFKGWYAAAEATFQQFEDFSYTPYLIWIVLGIIITLIGRHLKKD